MSDADRAEHLRKLIAGEYPDKRGRYGPFGGSYAPETLVTALKRLEQGIHEFLADDELQVELRRELKDWVGRPTALTHARGLSKRWGADVWLKREDLRTQGLTKLIMHWVRPFWPKN